MKTEIETLQLAVNEARGAARKAEMALDDARLKEVKARTEPIKAIAKRAHDALCQWNHTDGCSWGYEETAPDPWACDAHLRWLRRYDAILNGSSTRPMTCTVVEIDAILTAIEDLKPKVKTALFLLRGGDLVP